MQTSLLPHSSPTCFTHRCPLYQWTAFPRMETLSVSLCFFLLHDWLQSCLCLFSAGRHSGADTAPSLWSEKREINFTFTHKLVWTVWTWSKAAGQPRRIAVDSLTPVLNVYSALTIEAVCAWQCLPWRLILTTKCLWKVRRAAIHSRHWCSQWWFFLKVGKKCDLQAAIRPLIWQTASTINKYQLDFQRRARGLLVMPGSKCPVNKTVNSLVGWPDWVSPPSRP